MENGVFLGRLCELKRIGAKGGWPRIFTHVHGDEALWRGRRGLRELEHRQFKRAEATLAQSGDCRTALFCPEHKGAIAQQLRAYVEERQKARPAGEPD